MAVDPVTANDAQQLRTWQARAARCTTHHDACDCRTYEQVALMRALRAENVQLSADVAALRQFAEAWIEKEEGLSSVGDSTLYLRARAWLETHPSDSNVNGPVEAPRPMTPRVSIEPLA